MTRDELLELLARLRCAPVGRARLRAPHKPLSLLWLFGRFAATGSSAAAYAEAEEPVSALINDFGPAVASAAAARRRAAMPFIHLKREIWDLRDASGAEIGPRVPESGPWLTGHGAVGRLRPQVEQLLGDPAALAAARRLPDLHFTPGLSGMICDAVGLDLAVLELAGSTGMAVTRRSVRRAGFAERSCVPTPTSAPCAGSTGRLALTRWASRQRMCAGTARLARTWWPTAWRCARCITRCLIWVCWT